MEKMKIEIKPELYHSDLIREALKFFQNVLTVTGSLKPTDEQKIKNLASAFYKKANNRNLRDKKIDGFSGEIIFGFPLIWEDDLVLVAELEPQRKIVYEKLSTFFKELRALATIEYVKNGEGFKRNPCPPREAYLYKDHSGNIGMDPGSIAILRSIKASGEECSASVQRAIMSLPQN